MNYSYFGVLHPASYGLGRFEEVLKLLVVKILTTGPFEVKTHLVVSNSVKVDGGQGSGDDEENQDDQHHDPVDILVLSADPHLLHKSTGAVLLKL